MQAKTICFSFVAGLLLAVAKPAFPGVSDVKRDCAHAGLIKAWSFDNESSFRGKTLAKVQHSGL